ncbi:hypothetical protein [Flavitalea sp.]|nr:hypothetical protein [Flavitalea sp.]
MREVQNYTDHFPVVVQTALRLNLQYYVDIIDWQKVYDAESEQIELGISLGQHLHAHGIKIGYERIAGLKKKVDNLKLPSSNNEILQKRLIEQIEDVTKQLENFWHEMQADLASKVLTESKYKEYLIEYWKVLETGRRNNHYQSDVFKEIVQAIAVNRPLA